MCLEKIISEIKAAFSDVAYPGDDIIINEDCHDGWEGDEAEEMFRGKHWQDLTLEWLKPIDGSICYFSNDAFKFFLPGYMIAVLQDIHSEQFTLNHIIYLMWQRVKRDDPENAANADNFTPSQLRAIISFVNYVNDNIRDMEECIPVIEYYTRNLEARK